MERNLAAEIAEIRIIASSREISRELWLCSPRYAYRFFRVLDDGLIELGRDGVPLAAPEAGAGMPGAVPGAGPATVIVPQATAPGAGSIPGTTQPGVIAGTGEAPGADLSGTDATSGSGSTPGSGMASGQIPPDTGTPGSMGPGGTHGA